VVAFTFGLRHGFGFAGALREVGLPVGQIPVALLLFNVGVVLLLDGIPTGCVSNNNTMQGAVAAAQAAAFRTPSLRTHVLGVGANPGDWSSLAVAGGTNAPVYVAESTGVAIAAGLQTVRARERRRNQLSA
jgi:hypothetical protein